MIRIIGGGLCLGGIVLAVLGFAAPWTAGTAASAATLRVAFYTQNERFIEPPRIALAAASGEAAVTISAVPRFVERAVVAFDLPVHACRQDRDLHVFTLPLERPRFAIAFFAQPPGRNHDVTCRLQTAAIAAAGTDPALAALIGHTRLEYAAHPGLGTPVQREFPAWDKVLAQSALSVQP